MKIATRKTSVSFSSPLPTGINRCSVVNDNGSSNASLYHVPVNLFSSILFDFNSSFDGLLPLARSLRTNITCPSAGETKTPASLGIRRSGSRQKLAKKAESIQHNMAKR